MDRDAAGLLNDAFTAPEPIRETNRKVLLRADSSSHAKGVVDACRPRRVRSRSRSCSSPPSETGLLRLLTRNGAILWTGLVQGSQRPGSTAVESFSRPSSETGAASRATLAVERVSVVQWCQLALSCLTRGIAWGRRAAGFCCQGAEALPAACGRREESV
jgi:hypothetical protein